MNAFKRTKIVATLGPSITGKLFTLADLKDPKNRDLVQQAKKNFKQLFLNGVNVVRFNFSHADHEEHFVRYYLAKEVAKELNLNIGFMLDTKGPEIRVLKIKNDILDVQQNAVITIYCLNEQLVDEASFYVSDSTNTYNMAVDVSEQDLIYVDDGKLHLKVTKVDKVKGIIKTIALNSAPIKKNKRINLPNADYSLPFMSQKDYNDILFAIKYNFDYIAASFVNSAANVLEIKQILQENNKTDIQVISKIETSSAIKAIDSIIDASDGIMVARGDLGLEIPYYDVPNREKYVIKACRYKAKPVIVATQMLDSLETKMQPTRAEVTDVFFAVERGTDCTMLSGETANGLYPAHTVDVMSKINISSEIIFDYSRSINVYFKNSPWYDTKTGKKATVIANLVQPDRKIENSEFQYYSVTIFSNELDLALALSNIRAAAIVFLVTDNKELLNKTALNYAVYTHYVPNLKEAKANYQTVIKTELNSNNQHNNKHLVVFDEDIIEEFTC